VSNKEARVSDISAHIVGATIFLAAVLLGFGNLVGWWEVSWWVVATVWPIAPIVAWLLVVLGIGILTVVLAHLHVKR
jgi:hypothetical protein